MKLVLDLDYTILKRANDEPHMMTKQDTDYLNRIRPLYTPQQLQVLESFFEDKTSEASFDEIIVLARRHRDTASKPAPYLSTEQAQLLEAQHNESSVIESR